jgi:hypothetical protein
MLAVSASRQGLLLAFWLKATLYVDFAVSLGAAVAFATPTGAAELPGSAALANGQEALAVVPPAEGLLLALSLDELHAAMKLIESTRAPDIGTIFLICTTFSSLFVRP